MKPTLFQMPGTHFAAVSVEPELLDYQFKALQTIMLIGHAMELGTCTQPTRVDRCLNI